jgi:hypothetical protein
MSPGFCQANSVFQTRGRKQRLARSCWGVGDHISDVCSQVPPLIVHSVFFSRWCLELGYLPKKHVIFRSADLTFVQEEHGVM